MVGGGPSGLAAAIALRLAGCSVAVLEANAPPIDKACGEGLLPETLHALRRLGVALPPEGILPLQGIRFVEGSAHVQADFSGGCGAGVRRTVLHSSLTERARELEIELYWNTKGTRIDAGIVASGEKRFKPKLIVGADGQNSRVREAAGLNGTGWDWMARGRRYGFRRHYALAPWSPYVEVHWSGSSQMYVTPVSSREIGVALLTSDPHQRLTRAMCDFPELLGRLQGAQPTSREMGAETAMRGLRHVWADDRASGRVALVGDASGSVDAITGEGLGLAMRQAMALAQAFQSGDLGNYAGVHRRLRRKPATMATLLLLLARNERLRRSVFSCFVQYPALFQMLLTHHAGSAAAVTGGKPVRSDCVRPL